MRIVDLILNVIGWLQIAVGCTVIAGLLWLLFYYFDHSFGFQYGRIFVSIGFMIGAVWATIIWIRHGTVGWLSRIRRIE